MEITEENKRLENANKFLRTISKCGRHFFCHKGKVSKLELDSRGRVWFIDAYTDKRVYTHYRFDWRGFTEGGTLRALIVRLRNYIKSGEPFILPAWNYWGYGNDIFEVIKSGFELGLVAPNCESLAQIKKQNQ